MTPAIINIAQAVDEIVALLQRSPMCSAGLTALQPDDYIQLMMVVKAKLSKHVDVVEDYVSHLTVGYSRRRSTGAANKTHYKSRSTMYEARRIARVVH
jgi:hypothetical protein